VRSLSLILVLFSTCVFGASSESLIHPDRLDNYNPSLIEHQVKAQAPPPSARVQGYCYDIIKHMRTFPTVEAARANFDEFVKGAGTDPEVLEILEWYVPMVGKMIDLADEGKVQAAFDHCLENAKKIDPEA
jgi:hypothetical protein